jgi:hypothetical protein
LHEKITKVCLKPYLSNRYEIRNIKYENNYLIINYLISYIIFHNYHKIQTFYLFMQKKITILLGISSIFLAFTFQNRIDFPALLQQKLASFYQTYPLEKVYVQTDKKSYISGEQIWLKATLRYEDTTKIDSLSKVLYVELLNDKQQLITQQQLRIANNTAIGDIDLPTNLASGQYFLRAYTAWLRNFGEDNFFHKTLTITHFQDKTVSNHVAATDSTKPIIQFFPEGGDMIKSLRNHIAFKATDAKGNGVPVMGLIQNIEGKTYTSFKSNALGFGGFKLFPLGEALVAKVILASGDTATYSLPPILEQGLLLNVSDLNQDSIKVSLQSNLTTLANGKQDYYLVAQMHGEVKFMTKASVAKPNQIAYIDKKKIPTGVLHLSLIDENGVPHCERLVFVNHQDFLQISTQISKKEYATREKVSLDITTQTPEGKPISAEVSVLVIDNQLVNYNTSDENILSNLLLTSDLRGKIEQPAYYLQNTPEAKQALDYLLLTQGWRRFKWREILNGVPPKTTYPMEQGITIRGKVMTKSGKIVENAKVNMIANNDMRLLFPTTTNGLGEFEVQNLDFNDSLPFYINASARTLATLEPTIVSQNIVNSTYQPSIVSNDHFAKLLAYQEAVAAQKSFQQSFFFDKNINNLQEVVVKAQRRKDYDYTKNYPTAKGEFADAVIQDSAILASVNGRNVLFALQGRVAGLTIGQNNGAISMISIRRGGAPLILYNGQPVPLSFFNGIPSDEIAAIEVMKSGGGYGGRASNGVIAVYSKTREEIINAVGTKKAPNSVNTKIMGFYTSKEFFSPNYDTLQLANPDKRTTVYWKPRLQTDENGKGSVSFFTADLPTNYQIIVEGVAKKGTLLGHESKTTVQVRKK